MKLKFNSDGEFKILLFGDIHECGDYKASLNFKDMQKMMNAALDEFKPDLCVLLGDNCHGGVYKNEGAEKFKEMVSDLIAPMTRRGIPVAAIMGNHEHDHGIDDEIVAVYNSIDGCIMRNDAPEITGAANYKELIYSSDGEKPAFCLWFIDSNNLCEDRELSNYDYVHIDQIEWFENESAKLREANAGKPLPSFVFQHIPVPEEYRLLRKAKPWEIPVAVRGHNKKSKNFYVLKDGASGYLGEGPCAPDYNNGQFESWKKTGGVLGAFFGHDHLNDFSGKVDGILLAQHKTAGFRAYTDGCRCGVRLVTVYENNPENFTHEFKHFKEFGLKCECLGPVFKRITDRQSINLTVGSRIAAGAAAVICAGIAFKKIKGGKFGGQKG